MRLVQEGGGICIHIADSPPCTAETNITLQSNHTPPKYIKHKVVKITATSTLLYQPQWTWV